MFHVKHRKGKTMDTQTILAAISSVGFPIVACGIMFKLYYDFNNTLTELSSTLKTMELRIDALTDEIREKI